MAGVPHNLSLLINKLKGKKFLTKRNVIVDIVTFSVSRHRGGCGSGVHKHKVTGTGVGFIYSGYESIYKQNMTRKG